MVLVYDNSLIQNHPIAKKGYLSDLDSLCKSKSNYGKVFFHKPIICLDLDAYEKSISNQADATMDASVGIADYENHRKSNKRHLLIELKLGHKSSNNIGIKKLLQKYNHSRKDILINDRVDDKALFIYPDNIVPQAKHYFNRYAKQYREISKWEAIDVCQFLDRIQIQK